MRTPLLALLVALAGCTRHYVNPEKPNAQAFWKDLSTCEALAGQATSAEAGLARAAHYNEIVDHCLLGEGWTQQ